MTVRALRRAALGLPWGLSRPVGAAARPPEPLKILVLGYAAIGDLIFFLPVLEKLRGKKAKIVFVANSYPTTKELLPATGLVDEIILVDWENEPERRAEVNARLVAEKFDWAVLTLAAPAHYFKEALSSIPVVAGHERPLEGPWLSRVKRGLMTGEYARRALCNAKAAAPAVGEHSLARNLRLLDALGVSHDAAPRPHLPVGKFDAVEGPFVAVHLGAPNNQYSKMWPAERFRALCAALKQKIVVLGGPDESETIPGAVNLAGKLSLLDAFAALKKASLLICNDTGLAKAAQALGTPTATIWGPSDPREYGAVWDVEKHLDIRAGIACSPCSFLGMPKAEQLNYTYCGHHDCLGKIEAGYAEAAIRRKYPLIWPA